MSFENDFAKLTFNKENLICTIIAKKDLPANDEEFFEFLEYFKNFYLAIDQIDQKIILYYDLTKLGLLKLEHYSKWSEMFHNNEDISRKCLICSSVVTGNSIIANVINSILKFYDNQKPIEIFTNEADAFKFIKKNVKK